MFEKFLTEYITFVAGPGANKIVDVLFKKKNVNEFLIAKKLNLTINQTRNILYKLADSGLVYFMRKKDLKSGGWYTYFWTLNDYKCLVNYRNSIQKEVEQLESALNIRKTKQFYLCETCGIEVSDEQALSNDFTCVECGQVYSLKDAVQSINEIEKNINKLRDKVSLIQIEIDKIDVSNIPKEIKGDKKEKKTKKTKKANPKKSAPKKAKKSAKKSVKKRKK